MTVFAPSQVLHVPDPPLPEQCRHSEVPLNSGSCPLQVGHEPGRVTKRVLEYVPERVPEDVPERDEV